MKSSLLKGMLVLSCIVVGGCSESRSESVSVREKQEEAARTKAANKEMDSLPASYRSRDVFKKNDTPKEPVESSKD